MWWNQELVRAKFCNLPHLQYIDNCVILNKYTHFLLVFQILKKQTETHLFSSEYNVDHKLLTAVMLCSGHLQYKHIVMIQKHIYTPVALLVWHHIVAIVHIKEANSLKKQKFWLLFKERKYLYFFNSNFIMLLSVFILLVFIKNNTKTLFIELVHVISPFSSVKQELSASRWTHTWDFLQIWEKLYFESLGKMLLLQSSSCSRTQKHNSERLYGSEEKVILI